MNMDKVNSPAPVDKSSVGVGVRQFHIGIAPGEVSTVALLPGDPFRVPLAHAVLASNRILALFVGADTAIQCSFHATTSSNLRASARVICIWPSPAIIPRSPDVHMDNAFERILPPSTVSGTACSS